MMRSRMMLLPILWFGLAAGVGPGPLQNPDFELGAPGVPIGWNIAPAMRANGYQFEVSQSDPYAGAAAGRLSRRATRIQPGSSSDASRLGEGIAGAASQLVDIDGLRNHRVKFEAAVRVEPGTDPVGLWLRVDNADGSPAYLDNMMDRPITSSSWKVYSVEAYVPADAKGMLVGLLMKGSGAAEIDSAKLTDLGASEAPPAGEARAYLDRVIDLLSKRHINREKVDWDALRTQAYRTAGGTTEPRQTYQAIREVIRALGERHTYLIPPTAPAKAGELPPSKPLPQGKMIGRVGVLALPRLHRDITNPQDTGATYQNAIRHFLHEADGQRACGWIIDLREETGGDMWPGVRGLAPILGDGPYGAFVSGPSRKPWPQEPLPSNEVVGAASAPVAVLIGPHTASAGEMIAIAIAGRPAARFFGQPSAGLTTSNQSNVLSDGAVLALTSSFSEDRKGHQYTGPIQPDDLVPLDGAEAAARAWLAASGCR